LPLRHIERCVPNVCYSNVSGLLAARSTPFSDLRVSHR
jgi:hypothetical protein